MKLFGISKFFIFDKNSLAKSKGLNKKNCHEMESILWSLTIPMRSQIQLVKVPFPEKENTNQKKFGILRISKANNIKVL